MLAFDACGKVNCHLVLVDVIEAERGGSRLMILPVAGDCYYYIIIVSTVLLYNWFAERDVLFEN